jgi:hypothetical protein
MMGRANSRPPTPEAVETIRRARSGVWNVIMMAGLAIGASGLLLRRRQWDTSPMPVEVAWRWAHLALLGVIVASTFLRLLSVVPWAARSRRRFVGAHVAAALAGFLAIPIGFAFAWLVRPRLDAIAPFWAVALVLGFLSLPRADEAELIDGQRRLGPPDESQP